MAVVSTALAGLHVRRREAAARKGGLLDEAGQQNA
jgi:hypothetical protein